MSQYADFIAHKRRAAQPQGVSVSPSDINSSLFPFQRDVTLWALRRGRSAIWADCGLGKSRMALEWCRILHEHHDVDSIILTPLAVAPQFVTEGIEIGLAVTHCRSGDDVRPGVNVINYDRLHLVDTSRFGAVVLDESSCLKDYTSATRNALIESFDATPYKLACTATPSPNDVMELGNHAEFLGVMSRSEMLACYFVHDGGETQKWRLKRHAIDPFWKWVSTWAAAFMLPSDLGYDDAGYVLPNLNMHEVSVNAPDGHAQSMGTLFPEYARGLHEQRRARKASMSDRVAECAKIASSHDRPFIAWCDMNAESESLVQQIECAVEIRGSMSSEEKERRMVAFSTGDIRVLVTKPSICGWGVNWQHCADVAFVGLSHSFESWYQAIRRTWRFGQVNEVNCHIITSELDGAVLLNLKRKQNDAEVMASSMACHVKSQIRRDHG